MMKIPGKSPPNRVWVKFWDYFYRLNEKLCQQVRFGYSVSDVEEGVVTSSLSFLYLGPVNTNLSFSLRTPLSSDPLYWRLQGAAYYNRNPLIALIRGGYVPSVTPSQHLFAVGGWSNLPLRAERTTFSAASYIIGTLEYHYPLNPMLSLIAFTDGGVMWEEGNRRNIINLGTAFSIETPLGFPVRFDLGVNPPSGGFRFGVGFGASYHPPQ